MAGHVLWTNGHLPLQPPDTTCLYPNQLMPTIVQIFYLHAIIFWLWLGLNPPPLGHEAVGLTIAPPTRPLIPQIVAWPLH